MAVGAAPTASSSTAVVRHPSGHRRPTSSRRRSRTPTRRIRSTPTTSRCAANCRRAVLPRIRGVAAELWNRRTVLRLSSPTSRRGTLLLVSRAHAPQDYHNPIVLRVHYIETAAALWELIAAFGWWYTVRPSLSEEDPGRRPLERRLCHHHHAIRAISATLLLLRHIVVVDDVPSVRMGRTQQLSSHDPHSGRMPLVRRRSTLAPRFADPSAAAASPGAATRATTLICWAR
jgi:hypothetical protein